MQTTRCRVSFDMMQSSNQAFDLKVPLSDSGSLIPVNLCQMNRSVAEPDAGDTLSFPPSAPAKTFPKPRNLAESRSFRERLRMGNLAQYLEVHAPIVSKFGRPVNVKRVSAA